MGISSDDISDRPVGQEMGQASVARKMTSQSYTISRCVGSE